MSLPWLERWADRYARERFDIGRPSSAGGIYLTRWVLFGKRFGGGGRPKLYLHRFHRSDEDTALHDHPWSFTSLILWGGYFEWTPDRDGRVHRRWYGSGRVLTRPTNYRHRVELPKGKDCWTLVLVGPKVKSWSFFCLRSGILTGKMVPWRLMVDQPAAIGCGEE